MLFNRKNGAYDSLAFLPVVFGQGKEDHLFIRIQLMKSFQYSENDFIQFLWVGGFDKTFYCITAELFHVHSSSCTIIDVYYL